MSENVPPTPPADPNAEQSPRPLQEGERRVWRTEELLGDQREVLIQHGGDVYRLRVTRHGKLILYK